MRTKELTSFGHPHPPTNSYAFLIIVLAGRRQATASTSLCSPIQFKFDKQNSRHDSTSTFNSMPISAQYCVAYLSVGNTESGW